MAQHGDVPARVLDSTCRAYYTFISAPTLLLYADKDSVFLPKMYSVGTGGGRAVVGMCGCGGGRAS